MEQRLTLIEKKLIPQYTQGSPLLLEACALYLDNVSKQCIAQLKWKNIGSKPISAVMVELKCVDTFGHEVKKHQYQYNRLSAGKGKSFGGKEAIVLESDKVSRYEVCLKAVCFEDGKVQEYESPVAYTQLPETVPHWLTDDMLEQYERDLRQQNKNISVKNDIQEAAGLWQCVCGSWQQEGDACLECHAKRDVLIAASSPELIGEHLAEYCERQENDRKNAIYTSAKQNMERHDEESYEAAIKQLKSIPDWKDADELISVCQQEIVAIQEQKETERLAREQEAEQQRIKQQKAARKRKMWGIILSSLVCLAVVAFLLTTKVIIPNQKYDAAVALMKEGKNEEAIAAFSKLNGYKDSSVQITACETAILDGKYDAAVALMNESKYNEAITAFSAIETHRNSAEQIVACETAILDGKYDAALTLKNEGKYDEAIAAFTAIETHRDSAEQIETCKTAILDGKYDAAMALAKAGKYNEAIAAFSAIKTHKDSAEHIVACKYAAAVALMDEGEHAEAYMAFTALNGYMDSAAKANTLWQEHPIIKYQVATVGSYVTFGSYEQDKNTSNGKEDIEWLVLAKEDNRLLVISRYALDKKPYNEKWMEATWETCTLRKWLNNNFLNVAFSSTEKTMIPTVTIYTDEATGYTTDSGNATQDRVFLLSVEEVRKYLVYSVYSDAMECKPTAYARQGTFANNAGFCTWWLRSPSASYSTWAATVNSYGSVDYSGDIVDSDGVAVRPALWISLEKAPDDALLPVSSGNTQASTTKTGSWQGFASDVTVTVTLDSAERITFIEVDTSGETPTIGTRCSEDMTFLNQFIGQTIPVTNVDVLTGATFTSTAVINAVNSLAE